MTDTYTAGNTIMRFENGVLFVTYAPGTNHDLADAKLSIQKITEIFAGKKFPLLVDASNLRSMSRDARMFYAAPERCETNKAVAVLSDNLVSKTLANLYISVNKPSYPTRLFSTQEQALAWLEQYK